MVLYIRKCLLSIVFIASSTLSSRVVNVFNNGAKYNEGREVDLEDCEPNTLLINVIAKKLDLLDEDFNVHNAAGYLLKNCAQVKEKTNLYMVPKGKKFKRPQYRKPIKLSGKQLSWPVIGALFLTFVVLCWIVSTAISFIYTNKASNAFLDERLSDHERLMKNMVRLILKLGIN